MWWVWGRVKIMWGQRWYASKASEAWDVWGWGRMMGGREGVEKVLGIGCRGVKA